MSLIDTNFAEVPELSSVPPGEYQLTIESCEQKDSKTSGNPMIMIRFSIPSVASAKDITHVMMLPTEQDDEKTCVQKNGRIKKFLEAIGLPLQGFDPETAVGKNAWALLGEEENEEYGKQNRVKAFIKSR